MCASLCPKHTQLRNHVEIIERFLNKVLLSLLLLSRWIEVKIKITYDWNKCLQWIRILVNHSDDVGLQRVKQFPITFDEMVIIQLYQAKCHVN